MLVPIDTCTLHMCYSQHLFCVTMYTHGRQERCTSLVQIDRHVSMQMHWLCYEPLLLAGKLGASLMPC